MPKRRQTKCEACSDRGWLLAFNADRQITEIQRCDACERFKTDTQAGEAAVLVIEHALAVRLAKGQVVKVYEDPITKQAPEGKARLIRLVGRASDGYEDWRVEFENEPGEKYVRRLHPDDIVE